MNLWLAAATALLCALAGVALGRWFSRRRGRYWAIGYFIPLALILAFALAFHFPAIMFLPPFSWIMMGLKKVVLGDPLGGLDRLTYQEFAEKRRFIGIVLRRS